MAAKKDTTRRWAADKPRKSNELRQSLKKAQDEVAKLVGHKKAGRLTGRELKSELLEVQDHLERVLAFKKAFL